MGMGMEMMVEQMIEHDLWVDDQFRNIKNEMWETQDGEKLKISAMTTNHIHNCIRMLERKLERDTPYSSSDVDQLAECYLSLFKKELSKRYPPMDPAFADG